VLVTLLLVFSSVSALLGLWLIGDFASWEARGTKSAGEIEGFSKKKDKGRHLPVVELVTDKGPQKMAASQIDQMMYLLGRPKQGQVIDIIYMQDAEGNLAGLRVHGYMGVTLGAVMLVPFIIALGYVFGRYLLVTQGVFLLLFLLIAGGGMALLKLIQRIY
jgi:hypothetical protein